MCKGLCVGEVQVLATHSDGVPPRRTSGRRRLVAADEELARRLYPEADVEHLPFADNTLDAVVCAFGLWTFSATRSRYRRVCADIVDGLHFPGGTTRPASVSKAYAIAEVAASMPSEVP
jgi:hypothetical protein